MDLLKLLLFSSFYQNRDLEAISDANNFAKAMGWQVGADQQNAEVLQYLNEHKWNVLFDIVRMFPLHQSVIGYNIDYVAVVNTGILLQAIADNTKNIMDNAATENHSATFKVKYLDYTKLPDDVKVAYLRKNDCKHIVKNNIKIVQNKLTDDARGRQQKLNFFLSS